MELVNAFVDKFIIQNEPTRRINIPGVYLESLFLYIQINNYFTSFPHTCITQTNWG